MSAQGLVHPCLSVGLSSAPSRGSGLEGMLLSVCGANDRRGSAVMRRLRAWAPNTANLVSHPGSELLSRGSWASSMEQRQHRLQWDQTWRCCRGRNSGVWSAGAWGVVPGQGCEGEWVPSPSAQRPSSKGLLVVVLFCFLNIFY